MELSQAKMDLSQAKYADRILTHYIAMALRNAGVRVDSDTFSELDGLILNAVNEAVEVAVYKAFHEVVSTPE